MSKTQIHDRSNLRSSGSNVEKTDINDIIDFYGATEARMATHKATGKQYLHLITEELDENGKKKYLTVGCGKTVDIKSTTPEQQVVELIEDYAVFTGTTNAQGETIARWYAFGVEGELVDTPVINLAAVLGREQKPANKPANNRRIAGARS